MLITNFIWFLSLNCANIEMAFRRHLEEIILYKIISESYYRIKKYKMPIIQHIEISGANYKIQGRKTINYIDYLSDNKREDFLIEILYELYKDKSENKILLIKTLDFFDTQPFEFFKKIPDSIIDKLIKKKKILNFDKKYLKYNEVVADNNLMYERFVENKKNTLLCGTQNIMFSVKIRHQLYFFNISIFEILSLLIRNSNYKKLEDKVNSLKDIYNYFDLNEYMEIVLSDPQVEYYIHDDTNSILYSVIQTEDHYESVFSAQPPELILEVYENEKNLIINKNEFTIENEDKILISKKVLSELKQFFKLLASEEKFRTKITNINFYLVYRSDKYLEILENSLKDKLSRDYIILISLAHFSNIISKSEFDQLIQNTISVENTINKMMEIPYQEMCQVKNIFFQIFILYKISESRMNQNTINIDSKFPLSARSSCGEIEQMNFLFFEFINNSATIVDKHVKEIFSKEYKNLNTRIEKTPRDFIRAKIDKEKADKN